MLALSSFLLSVTGFTNPPIGKALIAAPGKKILRVFGIRDLELGATVIAEIELFKVTVKMGFAAMLVNAVHAGFEDREHVLNGVGVDRHPAFVADIFAG